MIKQRILDLLAMGRMANLPTVATHVIVASMLSASGAFGRGGFAYQYFPFDPLPLGAMILFACALYVGGCLLGDASDAAFDTKNRPERPIPLGHFSAHTITIVAYLLLGTSWILSCLLPLVYYTGSLGSSLFTFTNEVLTGPYGGRYSTWIFITSLLTISIIIYAKAHKKMGIGATVLMASCRSLLVIWSASFWFLPSPSYFQINFHTTSLLLYAAATFIYTLCLSLVARNESDPDAKTPSWAMQLSFNLAPLLLFAPIVLVHASQYPLSVSAITPIILAISIYLTWGLFSSFALKRGIPEFVSAALAGFCLMDACFAVFIDPLVALACFGLFLIALLLQRIAPAT
jgi:hypothetical protein